MKKTMAIAFAVALMISLVPATVFAGNDLNGNGAPNGAHYNLEIIGVPKGKTAPMDGNNGHRIFVPLSGNTQIWLSPGEFAVLDANGTDSNGAAFRLPVPAVCDAEAATCTVKYTVWVRALGKPGGSMDMQTCFVDQQTQVTYCSDPTWVLTMERVKGGVAKFYNASKELLFVSTDVDADGRIEHVALFSDPLDTYYWDVDNYGLRHAQLRFYMGDYTITW